MLLQEIAESSTSISTSTPLSSSSSVMKSAGDGFVHQIPAEVRKICVDHSTGETILHKAARLGYLVTISSLTLDCVFDDSNCSCISLVMQKICRVGIRQYCVNKLLFISSVLLMQNWWVPMSAVLQILQFFYNFVFFKVKPLIHLVALISFPTLPCAYVLFSYNTLQLFYRAWAVDIVLHFYCIIIRIFIINISIRST